MNESRQLFRPAELHQFEDWWMEARRIVMRHDDAFYGPMKGAKCGCDDCKWARRFVEIAYPILRTMDA